MKFMEVSSSYEESDIVLIGLPYDGTTSYRPGTRFATTEVRNNSLIGYETYSPVLNKDLENLKICDLGDLNIPYIDPKEVAEQIYKIYQRLVVNDKKIVTVGGEHSISYGIIKAFSEKHNRLKVIHLDAHTDLRDEYLGSRYSHAAVMRRVCEQIHPENLYQLGIRSGTKEEVEYAKNNVNFYPHSLEGLDEVIQKIGNDPVYISIDLDVLDPAYFPGTGTPEPDGVTSREFFTALYKLGKIPNVVGFDLVELAPKIDNTDISTSITIKALREMLLLI